MSTNSDEAEARLRLMRAVNGSSPFNAWAGFELVSAADGKAELSLNARPDLLQHTGFLHAGVVGALIDSACGFAAASLAGAVVASQYQVRCYRPAIGTQFIARAHVIRPGKRQVFASADVLALRDGEEILVAGGDAIFVPTA